MLQFLAVARWLQTGKRLAVPSFFKAKVLRANE